MRCAVTNSAAVNSLTSTAPASIFVLKLDANGVFQWVKGYGASSGLSVGYGIRHNSDPPAGAKKTDQLTTLNLVYNIK